MSTPARDLLEHFRHEVMADPKVAPELQRIEHREGVTVHVHAPKNFTTDDGVLDTNISVSPDDLRDDKPLAEMMDHPVRVTPVAGRIGFFVIEAMSKLGKSLANSGAVTLEHDAIRPDDPDAYRKLVDFMGQWLVGAAAAVTSRRWHQ
jgi:hypothetical protein